MVILHENQPTDAVHPIFFEMLNMPIFCNVLWQDRQAAQTCARGDIKLAFDPESGLIYNAAFEPERLQYDQAYENALDFSPRFQAYAQSLAQRLIDRYDLHQKQILEIGCGKGDFLILLCQLGNNHGVGFDPSYVPRLPSELAGRIQIVQDFYSEQYADYRGDITVCRHTLEHIQNPAAFLRMLRQTLGEQRDIAIFFEVPNALDTFRHLAIWDIIYEHCCYFAPVTLAYLFASCGFKVNALSTEYQGQFLGLEAALDPQPQSAAPDPTELQQLQQDILTFTEQFHQKVSSWRQTLDQLAAQQKRAVVWGAGSKGVTFLNCLQVQQQVEYVVDINPRKHGMYVAGTGQGIVPPERLREYQPEVVFIVNSIYETEIKQMLGNLGVEAELVCV